VVGSGGFTRRDRESTAGNPETSKQRTRAMAGMDAVEIKVTVRPDQELRVERATELNEDTAEV
jgi:hypothetical protein